MNRLVGLLAPDGFIAREESEARYPARTLPEGAIVTRSAPSPTGFVHIGTIYMSLINKLVAAQSQGVNMLRMEDTDKKREVKGGIMTIVTALDQFSLTPDEGVDADGKSYGAYGSYLQSERGPIYMGFAVELLKSGRAYPCFATAEELDTNYKQQQAEKVRPGYYGRWAIWRDKSEADITEALDSGRPFVLRFRSEGSHDKRIGLDDVLKGHIELPENDLDIPLIKSDEWRLPTYHLAHIVDDYLMRTNIILRGDEWLPSTPLHIELAQALGITPFRYAHFAPISVLDKGNKRKLSKRKDPEADIQYFVKAGYPEEAVLEYLVGLANSNFEEWRLANPSVPLWEFPFTFEKWSKARGALLDMAKLEDYAKDYIATLPLSDFQRHILAVASPEFAGALQADPDYTQRVLMIEREGDKPRKDLAKFADAYEQYGYFFDPLYKGDFKNRIAEELKDYTAEQISSVLQQYLGDYNYADDSETWLAKTRAGAEKTGLHMRDYTRVIRVKLTGKSRTPDLWMLQQTMGSDRVQARLVQ